MRVAVLPKKSAQHSRSRCVLRWRTLKPTGRQLRLPLIETFLLFDEQVLQTFFVLGLFQTLLRNCAFRGRQTDPEAGAPSCLGSYFEFRFFLL
jgi:hypothetical protein